MTAVSVALRLPIAVLIMKIVNVPLVPAETLVRVVHSVAQMLRDVTHIVTQIVIVSGVKADGLSRKIQIM